jgi:crotonobetainyl-CoA:carnitine CoA-transferase CaiB-like acyl-CoA transferase
VLELGTFFAAPFGATILAELGARVIKLEQLDGDPVRHVMPFPELGAIKVLQGKQSLGVDLASPEGRAIALELARDADIVLLAFRAGVAKRLGLHPDALRAANPDLVILEAPGYGTGPPFGHRPAFAPTIGAGSGMAYRNLGGAPPAGASLELGPEEVKREAIRLSSGAMAIANADGFSALAVASILLLGLYVRRSTGVGQTMSASMLSTVAHALSETMVDHDGIAPAPLADPELLGLGPWFRLYRCSHGWVFLAAPEPDDRAVVRRELGATTEAELADAFAAATADEWEARFTALDVACVAVAHKGIEHTIMLGETGRELGFVVDAPAHPVLEEHPRLAPLVRFSRSTPVTGGTSPLCGANTDAVLAGIGYDDARRTELRAAGIIS